MSPRRSLHSELIGFLVLALLTVGVVIPTPRRMITHAYFATYQATLGAMVALRGTTDARMGARGAP